MRDTINRRGMTLLELLCASMLATLLMVAVMGVVAGLAKTEKSLASRQPPAEWRRRLADRLADDLRAADRIAPVQAGFEMTGPLGVDPTTGVSDWTGARVVYRIESTPLGNTLLRILTADRVGAKPRVEILMQGIKTLITTAPSEVLLSDATETTQAATQPLPVVPDQTYANDVLQRGDKPPAVRFILVGDRGQALFDQVVLSR